MNRYGLICVMATATACSVAGGGFAGGGTASETGDDGSGTGGSADGSTGAADVSGTTDAESGGSSSSSTGDEPRLDVGGADDTGGPTSICEVPDGELSGSASCRVVAPPDSFDPQVQWSWMGVRGQLESVSSTPLVANLTDDNGDGAIDLCDVPDIVVVAYVGAGPYPFGTLVVLDGETGEVHWTVEQINPTTVPAIGDIDGDGVPDIVATRPTGGWPYAGVYDWYPCRLVALAADGELLWEGDTEFHGLSSAVALGDADNDGDIEIFAREMLADHTGHTLWRIDGDPRSYLATMADLDDDDDLEIVMGGTARHHDGSIYFDHGMTASHPSVVDLDGDGLPEVVLVGGGSEPGLSVIEHDGTVSAQSVAPTLVDWVPLAVHDLDGDDEPDLLTGAENLFGAFDHELGSQWTAVVDDYGYASATAFDFLGDATAEAMYADETAFFAFDADGDVLMTAPRSSWTQWENPVVADVDNDGSAEIVVVSNGVFGEVPLVQVLRDAEDRWVPARRIWNQHTYHVTNVREDGTIPSVEPHHWESFNTFRTQAQIGPGGVCRPEG